MCQAVHATDGGIRTFQWAASQIFDHFRGVPESCVSFSPLIPHLLERSQKRGKPQLLEPWDQQHGTVGISGQ